MRGRRPCPHLNSAWCRCRGSMETRLFAARSFAGFWHCSGVCSVATAVAAPFESIPGLPARSQSGSEEPSVGQPVAPAAGAGKDGSSSQHPSMGGCHDGAAVPSLGEQKAGHQNIKSFQGIGGRMPLTRFGSLCQQAKAAGSSSAGTVGRRAMDRGRLGQYHVSPLFLLRADGRQECFAPAGSEKKTSPA